MEFRHTLLPAPVAPATSRWGMRARSATVALPAMSLPMAMVSMDGAERKVSEASNSLKHTFSRASLGISMPTVSVPGMGAWMRTAMALSASARSSLRLAIRLTFTPGAGRTSNMVTTGPGVMRVSSPCTPKSARQVMTLCPLASST